jgi:hypothetical protein
MLKIIGDRCDEMSNSQERLYQASRIVEIVATDLCDFVGRSTQINDFEVVELVGRLDLAVEVIRWANGAAL